MSRNLLNPQHPNKRMRTLKPKMKNNRLSNKRNLRNQDKSKKQTNSGNKINLVNNRRNPTNKNSKKLILSQRVWPHKNQQPQVNRTKKR
jgi:hypothetical protein